MSRLGQSHWPRPVPPSMVRQDRYEPTPFRDGTELRHTKPALYSGILRIMEGAMRRQLFPRQQARSEQVNRGLTGCCIDILGHDDESYR